MAGRTHRVRRQSRLAGTFAEFVGMYSQRLGITRRCERQPAMLGDITRWPALGADGSRSDHRGLVCARRVQAPSLQHLPRSPHRFAIPPACDPPSPDGLFNSEQRHRVSHRERFAADFVDGARLPLHSQTHAFPQFPSNAFRPPKVQ